MTSIVKRIIFMNKFLDVIIKIKTYDLNLSVGLLYRLLVF